MFVAYVGADGIATSVEEIEVPGPEDAPLEPPEGGMIVALDEGSDVAPGWIFSCGGWSPAS